MNKEIDLCEGCDYFTTKGRHKLGGGYCRQCGWEIGMKFFKEESLYAHARPSDCECKYMEPPEDKKEDGYEKLYRAIMDIPYKAPWYKRLWRLLWQNK